MKKNLEIVPSALSPVKCAVPESWDSLTQGLTAAEKDFFRLRLLGMDEEGALVLIKKRYGEKVKVFNLFDERWAALYDHMNEASDLFRQQAYAEFIEKLPLKAKEMLDYLLDLGLRRWDLLDRYERQYVWRAVELGLGRADSKTAGQIETYEELVIKMRKGGTKNVSIDQEGK